MKRLVTFALIITLAISLAAPAGAVFASEGTVPAPEEAIATTESVEVVEVVPETTIPVVQEVEALEVPAEIPTLAPEEPAAMPEVATTEKPEIAEPIPSVALAPEPPVVPAPALKYANDVVITEIQTRGAAGASSELIELFNASSEPRDVTNWCVKYASASGTSYTKLACMAASDNLPETRVVLVPKGYMVLATVDRKTEAFVPDATFSATLTEAGGRLRIEDEQGMLIDMVGWGAATEFMGAKSASAVPTTAPLRSLQRVSDDSGYIHTPDSSLDFAVLPAKTSYQTGALAEVTDVCVNIAGIQQITPDGTYRNKRGECVDRSTVNFCEGVKLHEIGANVSQQFIELVNTSSDDAPLAGCRVMTNRSSSVAATLPDIILPPGGYYVLAVADTSLKLTKSTTGTVYLLASDAETEIDSRYYEDLSTDTSWAQFADGWKQTYTLTPGASNVYEQYAACTEGYYRNTATGRCNKEVAPALQPDCGEGRERNPATGRCRNVVVAVGLTPCKEGQYRSEETSRCRSLAATVAGVLKPCGDDQFRNPATNRCKKIASADDAVLADCGEGRERNPETNRCRNILAVAPAKVAFPVEETKAAASALAAWWVFGGIAALALGYAAWEWRAEIRQGFARMVSIGRHGK